MKPIRIQKKIGPWEARKLGYDEGVKVERTRIETALEDHYWDTFHEDRELILKHIDSILLGGKKV